MKTPWFAQLVKLLAFDHTHALGLNRTTGCPKGLGHLCTYHHKHSTRLVAYPALGMKQPLILLNSDLKPKLEKVNDHRSSFPPLTL